MGRGAVGASFGAGLGLLGGCRPKAAFETWYGLHGASTLSQDVTSGSDYAVAWRDDALLGTPLLEDATAGHDLDSNHSIALGTTRWGVVVYGRPVAVYCHRLSTTTTDPKTGTESTTYSPWAFHLVLWDWDTDTWVEHDATTTLSFDPHTQDPSPAIAVGPGTEHVVLAYRNRDAGITIVEWESFICDPTRYTEATLGGAADAANGTDCTSPAVDVGETGGAVVAWADSDTASGGRVHWAAAADNATLGSSTRWTTDTGSFEVIDSTGTRLASDTPSVAVVSTGAQGSVGVVVAWRTTMNNTGDFSSFDIHYAAGEVANATDGATWATALDGAPVTALTSGQTGRDPCVWSSTEGAFWLGYTDYGSSPVRITVWYAAPGDEGAMRSSADASGTNLTEKSGDSVTSFNNFVNGFTWVDDATGEGWVVVAWENGPVTLDSSAGDSRQVFLNIARTSADPLGFASEADTLPASVVGDDEQAQYPSLFVTDRGSADGPGLWMFYVTGQGVYDPADPSTQPVTYRCARGELA